MERVLASHRFGPHRVDVVEHLDDDGSAPATVVIDGQVVTEPPLPDTPTFEQVVRLYAQWRDGR